MSDLPAKIEEMFQHEDANPKKVTRADEVPLRYEWITTDWLTDVLCKSTPGARVEAFNFGPKDDGSSNRRRIFLEYNEIGRRAGLPATAFSKASTTLESRLILGPPGTARGEVIFYNSVRPRLNIEAPKALHAAYDAERYSYIVLLEDMADQVEFCTHDLEVSWAQAVDQIELLAELHGAFHEKPDLAAIAPFHTWPDFWRNMHHHAPSFAPSCGIGFAAGESVIPPDIFARRNDIWNYTERSVEAHRTLPRTVIHCDVHLRNWYITKAGAFGLTDWQIVTLGHWSRDFIYAVTTCLGIEARRQWLEPLLAVYLDRLAEKGVPKLHPDEALRLCRQQLFSALAFWTITLRPASHMPDMQPETAALAMIERISTAMSDLDAFGAF